MRNKPLSFLCMAVALLLVSSAMFAHHGTAAYDMTKLTTLKGTVTDFRFINPHSEIYFDVKDDKDNVENWIAEANSVPVLSRFGWNKTTLKPGDQIIAAGNRSKNGSTTMHLRKIVLSNGQELSVDRDYDNY
jgi:hypothetical protein